MSVQNTQDWLFSTDVHGGMRKDGMNFSCTQLDCVSAAPTGVERVLVLSSTITHLRPEALTKSDGD